MIVKVIIKRSRMGAALLGVLLTLTACMADKTDVSFNAAARTTTPMRVVTDDLGRTVKIPAKVNRVISLAPNLTESIFAVGAGDRLVGVTTFCNYPDEAKAIAKIGDTMTPNMESIVALKPDIVFVSTASQIQTFMTTLEANGIAVYVLSADSLQAVYKDLHQLGIIFDTTAETERLVDGLAEREQSIEKAVGSPIVNDELPAVHDKRVGVVKVFVQISKEPLFTIGKGAFLNDLIKSAGGRSVTENVGSAFPKLSKETALALQPEAIILSDSEDNREPNEVFRNSPAVKNGHVYRINADLLSRPGPRLVDALEAIARDLHPEKFPH
ncbi:MAG: helical backbone metal receptor [Acidobacteriota bacterium]